MIDFPGEVEESKERFLNILHASLPSEVSCIFIPGEGGKKFRLEKVRSEKSGVTIDLSQLTGSASLAYVTEHQLATCSGHILLRILQENRKGKFWTPCSVMNLPHRNKSGDHVEAIFCFIRFAEDAYRDEDLYFARSMYRRYQLFLDYYREPDPHFITAGEGNHGVRTDLKSNPYYLTNLLSAFVQAGTRTIPLEGIDLTLWSDVVPKGEFLQIFGYSNELLGRSGASQKSKMLERHLGSAFKVKNFSFFYRSIRLRADVEEVIPRPTASVSSRLELGNRILGSVTLRTNEPEARDSVKKGLADLTHLILWEMQIARRRIAAASRVRGSNVNIVKPKAFQDDLIEHFRSARRYGDALSAVVFRPSNPFRLSGPREESFSRLFLLMRKSIRSVDSACFFGLNGFLILLPRATYREALKVTDRLLGLADEVIKHDRSLDKKTALECQVVSFPESAKSEIELWERISDAVPV